MSSAQHPLPGLRADSCLLPAASSPHGTIRPGGTTPRLPCRSHSRGNYLHSSSSSSSSSRANSDGSRAMNDAAAGHGASLGLRCIARGVLWSSELAAAPAVGSVDNDPVLAPPFKLPYTLYGSIFVSCNPAHPALIAKHGTVAWRSTTAPSRPRHVSSRLGSPRHGRPGWYGPPGRRTNYHRGPRHASRRWLPYDCRHDRSRWHGESAGLGVSLLGASAGVHLAQIAGAAECLQRVADCDTRAGYAALGTRRTSTAS